MFITALPSLLITFPFDRFLDQIPFAILPELKFSFAIDCGRWVGFIMTKQILKGSQFRLLTPPNRDKVESFTVHKYSLNIFFNKIVYI